MQNYTLVPVAEELIKNSEVMVALIKGDKFAYVNPALQRRSGYSLEELHTMDFWDIAHPDHRDLLREKARAEQRGEEKRIRELSLVDRKGNSFWVHIETKYITSGEEAALVLLAFDIDGRMAQEVQLLRQNEPLVSMLENNPVATLLADHEGIILYISRRFTELTGYTIEDISNSSLWEEKLLEGVPNHRTIMQSWHRNLKDKGYSKGRVKLRLRNGERRYFNIHSVASPEGYIILTAWDINEQVEARKILQESEARLKALAEASLEGIIITENRICIEANPATAKLFGFSREELVGRDVLEFVAVEAKEIVKGQMMGHSRAPYKAVILHRDGQRIPVEVQAREFEYRGRIARAAAIRDLSERQKAQEEIYRQRSNLQALFYNALNAIALCEPGHRILEVNPRFTELFGLTIEECEGALLWEVLIPKELGEEAIVMFEKVSVGQAISWESARKRKDGELLPVLITMIPIDSSGYYVLYTDISERKAAEATIQQQILELEAKNSEMERFTYTVSHDLRSPLITIKGFSGLLLQDLEKGRTDRLAKDIKRIIKATDKMEELLQDLLELSRVGRVLNPLSTFPMKQLCHEVLELMNGPISRKKAKVSVASYMPWVQADRRRIAEVLQNLLENALKFMGDNKQPYIEIGYFPAGAEQGFFVKDNGIGIESRYMEKIFGLFDKLEQKSKGTGIGLALVKRIIGLHQGRIWVESDGPGLGSTFYFTLPATSIDRKGEHDG